MSISTKITIKIFSILAIAIICFAPVWHHSKYGELNKFTERMGWTVSPDYPMGIGEPKYLAEKFSEIRGLSFDIYDKFQLTYLWFLYLLAGLFFYCADFRFI